MPPCRSSSSQSRASTPSQNSMSPLNPSEPLTPPELSVLAQHPIPSPSQHYGMSRPTLPQSCSFDAFSAGSASSGMGYSPSMLMPPPSSYPNGSYMPVPAPGSSFSPLMSSPLRPHDVPYSEHYGSSSQFGSYPQPYPYPHYGSGVPMTQTMSHQSTTTSFSGMNTDTDAEAEDGFAAMLNMDGEDEDYRQSSAEPSANTKISTIPKLAQPPRPPNAWILYRSEKLKAIREGRQVEGLDKVMSESGLSSSASASSGEESLMNGGGSEGEKPKVSKRKGKKGVKEPTEGLLRMGKGKTGRGLPQAHISKMISELWKKEPLAVRGEYERRSEIKKLEHAEKYPDYKFQPMRKADKVRAKEERDREKLVVKREKEAKANAAKPRKNGTRSRPSTATSPYSTTPRGMARSVSMTGIQHSSNMLQQVGNGPLPSPASNFPAFPIPGDYLPSLGKNGSMGPPRSTTSHSSRQTSPTKTPSSRSSAQMDQSMPPPPVPHTPAPDVYDPGLNDQYQPQYQQQPQQQQQYQYHPMPQVQYLYPAENQDQPQIQAGPSYSQPDGPFYYDIHGTGPAYALPVVYEPQILPDGQSLDDLALDFDFTGNIEDLVEQWVTLEEDTTEGNEDGGWSMQAPDLAVSSWDNLAPEGQEQVFADLDLSHTMAVHLTPDLANHEVYNMYSQDQTPMIDYSSGYMSYPIYDTTQNTGPFLYTPQPTSPNGNDATTPRQATFNRNPSNVYHPDEERRISHGMNTNTNGSIPTRYVSSSAFPETPLSVDPRGLGQRQVSYANTGLDEYDWVDPDPSDSDFDQDQDKNEQSWVQNKTQSMPINIPAPLDLPSSPISPIDSNIQIAPPIQVETTSPQKPGAGPPRGQRRARTVAGSFH